MEMTMLNNTHEAHGALDRAARDDIPALAQTWDVPREAAAICRDAVVCDLTLPWTGYGRSELRSRALPRMHHNGFDFVSLTLCTDAEGPELALRRVAAQRQMVREHPTFRLIDTADDILAAKASGQLAIAFNFQGTNAIGGDVSLIEAFYRLGVKHMLMAYNRRNAVGDGCHERTDSGLSYYGVEVVREMNRVGMIVDCSHTSYRTTLDVMSASLAPVIFSHSNPKDLWSHDRNITNDQAVKCAGTGGLVGVNGVDIFLNDRNETNSEVLFDVVDYYYRLIGPDHIGLGLDFVYDSEAMMSNMVSFAFQGHSANYDKMRNYFEPEQLPRLIAMMLSRGYSDDDLRKILGGNFMRIARHVWKS
jgi:membrane dipeptidase